MDGAGDGPAARFCYAGLIRRERTAANETTRDGPMPLLDGVRVLDLTNVLAGPFACYQLAVLGAEVIKVEVPGSGDLARQLGADRRAQPAAHGRLVPGPERRQAVGHAQPQARGRQGGVPPAGRQLRTWWSRTSARRDGPARPRLRRAAQEVRPDLVYCAISGFGQDGPLRDNPAYDQIIQGLSGVMSVTGTPETAPLRVGYPVCDTIGGITAAFAIAAALVQRERTGEGECIDVSMLEATLVTMGWAVSNWLIAGVRPTPMGNENMTAAPSGAFRTGQRPAQHRRQQAGAVRGAGPARRPAGARSPIRASPTARTARPTATS